MGLSREEYWSGLPWPPPGDLPDPGITAASLLCPALAGRFFTTSATWEVPLHWYSSSKYVMCIKTIPNKKECKQAKWLSEEALEIAEKRREAKGKGEKERYTHLNAEFQRIARRDKKAFLNDQRKEIEENNGIGKTRDLFKKIRDTKGTFNVKMGTIKDRNSMAITEAEDIKKRWQEYREELYKKDLHDPDNHNGVITHTHLEPDILEYEVKWGLGNITTKLVEVMEFQLSYFKP